MKVKFLLNDITEVGGVSRVVTSLANGMVKYLNYDVEIISFRKQVNEKICFELDKRINIKYINYVDCNTSSLMYTYNEFKAVKNVLLNEQCDVLFTLYTHHNVVAALIKNRLKYKVIACRHSQFFNDTSKWIMMKKIFYRNLDKLIVLTERENNIYKKYCKNTSVISNPSPFETSYQYDKDSNKILNIGRLDKGKTVNYTIEAFSKIHYKYPQWVLEIVGEGEEKENLKKIVRKLNLEEKVIFTDFTLNVIDKYREAAFTVLTSQTEAMPMVLIESKTCGVPSISFDIESGPREIIEDMKDGILVEKNNVDKLAEAMELLICNNKLRLEMSKKCYENSYKYNIKNIVNIWKNEIDDICKK